MSNAPKSKKLTVDSGQEPGTQIQQMIEQLNSFMSDTHQLFDGGITAENLQRQSASLLVVTDGTGKLAGATEFTYTLPSRPKHITHGQVTVVSGAAPTGAVDVSQWTLKPGNKVSFSAIPGLAANSRYSISLVVE